MIRASKRPGLWPGRARCASPWPVRYRAFRAQIIMQPRIVGVKGKAPGALGGCGRDAGAELPRDRAVAPLIWAAIYVTRRTPYSMMKPRPASTLRLGNPRHGRHLAQDTPGHTGHPLRYIRVVSRSPYDAQTSP